MFRSIHLQTQLDKEIQKVLQDSFHFLSQLCFPVVGFSFLVRTQIGLFYPRPKITMA